MEHNLPDYLVALNVWAPVAVAFTLVGGIWLAARRTDLAPHSRRNTAIVFSLAAILWYFAASWLAQRNAVVVPADGIPVIQYAIFAPILAGLIALLATRSGKALVTAAPQSWLVAVQTYRAFGGMFLLLWAKGQMPGEFAIPAGTGDVIVGLTAPFVAWLNTKGSASAPSVTRLWNVFGIADLLVAVTTGFLTSPSALQMLAFDRPNTLIAAYPIAMVPVFLVPLAIILHGVSLWKLGRARVPHTARCVNAAQAA